MGTSFRIVERVTLLAVVLCGVWIFYATPTELNMGFVQKIMYLHLPTVLVTYAAFFIVFVCSIAYLWKRDLLFDVVAKCATEIGVIFCGLVLLTGAIWGKPTWGTYWVWDARLTTTLLLFLIYLGVMLLRQFITDREQEARFAAILGIIGFLDIPIIHKSVEWWRTLHQPSTLFKVNEAGEASPSMPPELLYPLLGSLAVAMLFFGYLLYLRIQVEQTQEKVAQLLLEQGEE